MITLKRKLTAVFAILILATGISYSQVFTVRNTNPNGPDSFQDAINQALNLTPAGVKTINFEITPLAATYTISPGNLNLYAGNATTLIIDGTSQPGYTPGNPVIILDGVTSTLNCFSVNRSDLTIKGFIVHNYRNGYYQNGGNVNIIENCWFGVDATGTTAVTNKEFGVYVTRGSVSIGSQTDFTAATRNIVSGSGVSGIKFFEGLSGSYIGNTFVGTDKTGSVALGNGWDATAGTEFRHGITIDKTPSVTIKNNVISGNYSGGIDFTRESENSRITGNKIGTNLTGTAPLGNKTFGIRIKDSGGHIIGGDSTKANRNIISANGSSDYPFEQNTTDKFKFDWYNSCGIYLFNSSNNIVAGNYIGVDISGNTYAADPKSMGNFYCGLKIDATSSSTNNKIGLVHAGNIIGQNGFRSSIDAATLNPPPPLDGHGIIIKDAFTTGTVVYGNSIGIGSNGTSKVGNKQDGISIQGAAGTIVGGGLAGQRNVIGNNTWGIFIASNYYNSQTSNTTIQGNYIGTNATGTAAIGNGTRADNNSGGGIGIQHNTQGTTVGGNTAALGNVISGNRLGMNLLGNTPIASPNGTSVTGSKIYGNLIGLGANGTTIIPNLENGIFISEKANNNDIGGTTDAGQGNKIAGNGQNGIYSQDATNNRISRNTIYSNTVSGIGFDLTTTNTVQSNFIYSNPANGIVLKGASNGNKFFGNTIGDLTVATKGNTGDGINITASSNNIIGGINAGEGNTIANNSGNAINILGVTSNNNSIHRNQIFCNGLRGIELNGVANANYAKPTFSGSETTLIVTGPTGSYIELYSLDGCNNCTVSTSKKLQGKTLVASGNSPLNYAGTAGVTYTATASEFFLSNGHKTSEFSDCYSLCPAPVITNTVSGSTVCQNSDGTVTINNAQAIRYDALIAGTSVANGTGAGNGTALVLTIPKASLANATKAITFTATPAGAGCSPVVLTNNTSVIVNPAVITNLTVVGDTVCQNTAAKVTIKASQNLTYRAYLNTVLVGTGTGNAPNDLVITIPAASLATGPNVINFTAQFTGSNCPETPLTNTATVIVNPTIVSNLVVVGDTVCTNTPAIVTIRAAQNLNYTAFINNVQVGSGKGNAPANLLITIPAASLSVGSNIVSFTGQFDGDNCPVTPLTNSATVVLNPAVITNLAVKGDTICQGGTAVVTIFATQNLLYTAYKGTVPVGTGQGNSPGNTNISIPGTSLAVGDNVITFKAQFKGKGCPLTDLENSTIVILNTPPKITSAVTSNSPICFGAQGIVNVATAEKGKYYQVFDQSNKAVSDLTMATANDTLKINIYSLPVNNYTLTVKASVPGCAGTVNLTQTVGFAVNKGLNGALSIKYVSEICLGTTASITIEKSENLVAYQAFNQKDDSPVSAIVTGDGNDKIIALFPLPAGTNVIYFKATIGGCGSVKLGNTATIKVNTDVKKNLVATATSPICLGDIAIVKIEGSETDKTYEIFENKVSVSARVPGNNGTININVPGLAIGDHKFTVNVTVPGCKSDTLLQNPFTKVNSAPDSTLKVGTNGPVCAGNQAVFYIIKSQPGKKYQIFNNSASVSQVAIGNGDTLKINLNNLQPGVYTLTARATADGCSSSTNLSDKGTITINSTPEKDLIATVNGPVCLGNPAIVTVEKAEAGKSYQVYYNGTAVSAQATGNSDDLTIPVNTRTIPAGTHALSIGIKVHGCTADSLARKPLLTINTSPDSSLLVTAVTSPVCIGTDGAVRISGVQQKVSYQAFIGLDPVSQNLTGNGPDLILPVPAAKLLPGLNNISVKASIAGCTVDNLADTAGIKVNPNPKLDLNISVAPDTICEGGESILTIATSESGVTYQAVVGNKTVSNAVLSNGGQVDLILSGLALGDNIVGVKALVGGCSDKNLDKSLTVKVNKGPKINYGVTGSTVCKGTGGTVTINGSEIGASYEAFNKATNTSVSGMIAGTGGAITIPLNPSNNPADSIIIKSNVTGCGIVRLDSVAVVITNDIEVSKKLPVAGSTICINDANATATVKNAVKDVIYEATVNNTKLPVLTGSGTDLIFTVASNLLTEGNNTVTFIATAQGCGPVALDSVAIIAVNNNNTSKDLPTRGSDICIYDVNGTATVLSAKKGIAYQATIGTTPLPEILTGNDADLTFTIPVANINMGSNTVTFSASVAGCTSITMSNTAIINRNDNTTSKTLDTKGSTVCGNDPFAIATVIGAKAGISYQAFKGQTAISGKLVGNDADLDFSLNIKDMSAGNNIISFVATVAGCADVKLDNDAIVIVLGEKYTISGSSLRCNNTDGAYKIDSVPGITSYKWTVPNGATIVSGEGSNSIQVTFGTESGLVSVAPVGSVGTCTGITSELFVRVEPPFTDTISIIGNDTLCVGDANRIYADSSNVFGVDRIDWSWSSDIQIVDTLDKISIFRRFGIKHPVVGRQMIIATPHITCSDSYGVPDTLIVTVLAYPKADAGVYPLIQNDLRTPVTLDGTGSDIEGDTPNDSIKYSWYSFDRLVSISNPGTLNNAYFVPKETETTVYLSITNHNRCLVIDSAVITVAVSVEIPNVFTPNNDGTHDKWEIRNLNTLYPNCSVEVFNKWGSYIFSSNGYAEAWDGTRNGEEMPVATYYYVVDFRDGSKPKRGSLTIIR